MNGKKKIPPLDLTASPRTALTVYPPCSKCGAPIKKEILTCDKCGHSHSYDVAMYVKFTAEQVYMLNQLIGVFGENIQDVTEHIITESLPEYVERNHMAYANYKATLDIKAMVQRVVDTVEKQQERMRTDIS